MNGEGSSSHGLESPVGPGRGAEEGERTVFVGVAGGCVRVDLPSRPALQRVKARLGPAAGRSTDSPILAHLTVEALRPKRFSIREGSEDRSKVGLRRLADVLEEECLKCLVREMPDVLWLHAGGAVDADGRAMILPGKTGRGKSSLSAALVRNGWKYLTDEHVPISTDDITTSAFPRPAEARERVRGVVIDLEDEESFDENWQTFRRLKKRRWRIPLDRIAAGRAPIGAIVFPDFRPDVGARLTPLKPAQAALRLIESARSPSEQRAAVFEKVAELVQRVPAWEITFDRLRPAVHLLTGEGLMTLPAVSGAQTD